MYLTFLIHNSYYIYIYHLKNTAISFICIPTQEHVLGHETGEEQGDPQPYGAPLHLAPLKSPKLFKSHIWKYLIKYNENKAEYMKPRYGRICVHSFRQKTLTTNFVFTLELP